MIVNHISAAKLAKKNDICKLKSIFLAKLQIGRTYYTQTARPMAALLVYTICINA